MFLQNKPLRFCHSLFSIVLFAVGVVILFSCNNGEQREQKQHLPMATFSGAWVRADYVQAVLQTRSPYAAKDKLEKIAAFLIDTTNVQGDSLSVGASWNNHEGYAFHIIARQGHSTSSFVTDISDFDDSTRYYELGYRAGANRYTARDISF